MVIPNNIVSEDKVREIQKETLDIIAKALTKSFGPKGSTTAFVKNLDQNGVNIVLEYTKDGHTIIKNIQFINPIERSVQDLLTDLTRYIVKEVGDGTTSAIILCKTIFDALLEDENLKKYPPADILSAMDSFIKDVSAQILARGKECTIDDIYNIALISTNNNTEIAGTIRSIYEQFGLDIFIDVGISTEVDNIVKQYDGMTLETGYTDPCFINMKEKKSSYIPNPKIYCFNDPIDTPEQLAFLDAILCENILEPANPNSVKEFTPTVIFCKHLTPDSSSYFETVVKLMKAHPGQIPLLIVSDIHQEYLYEDIRQMCGAPLIKKYLNPDIQKADQLQGLAPTADTIFDFCGHAEAVESDAFKTKIIRPEKMFNEDGSYSDDYNALISILEDSIQKAKDEDADQSTKYQLKRRLNSLKGNMVDFLVGGITVSDRNNLKASVEDAVLNCRSAAVNGVGYGANYMAYSTIDEYDLPEDELGRLIYEIFHKAYRNLTKILYSTIITDDKEIDDAIIKSLRNGCPMNIRTKEYDGLVKSSIKSDIVILETVGKMIGLMFTTNQYLVPTPMHNIYTDYSKSEK